MQASDPNGLCDQAEVAFTVRDENDPPQIEIADQATYPGKPFFDLVPAERVSDEKSSNDQITWKLSWGKELSATLQDGILSVEPPDQEWQGSEMLQVQACDPEEACSRRVISLLSTCEVECTQIAFLPLQVL